MPFAQVDIVWRITLLYLAFLLGAGILMKFASAVMTPGDFASRARFFVFSPILAMSTWQREQPAFQAFQWQGLLMLMLLCGYYAVVRPLVSTLFSLGSTRAYFAIIPFYLLVEGASFIVNAAASLVGIHIPPINDHPYRAESLAEFWGRRWNIWFSDWFKEVCFKPLWRRPVSALMFVFLVSGIIHEMIVSAPFWLTYHRSILGWVTSYFLIQAFGILLERRFLRQKSLLRRAFLWIWLIGPAPLVLNEGTIRIFHLL